MKRNVFLLVVLVVAFICFLSFESMKGRSIRVDSNHSTDFSSHEFVVESYNEEKIDEKTGSVSHKKVLSGLAENDDCRLVSKEEWESYMSIVREANTKSNWGPLEAHWDSGSGGGSYCIEGREGSWGVISMTLSRIPFPLLKKIISTGYILTEGDMLRLVSRKDEGEALIWIMNAGHSMPERPFELLRKSLLLGREKLVDVFLNHIDLENVTVHEARLLVDALSFGASSLEKRDRRLFELKGRGLRVPESVFSMAAEEAREAFENIYGAQF